MKHEKRLFHLHIHWILPVLVHSRDHKLLNFCQISKLLHSHIHIVYKYRNVSNKKLKGHNILSPVKKGGFFQRAHRKRGRPEIGRMYKDESNKASKERKRVKYLEQGGMKENTA